MFTVGVARQVRQVAVGIARSGRLDLDHVGAEIRQHGCGRGRSDKARAVQNLEAFEDAVFHGGVAPVTFVDLIPRYEIALSRWMVSQAHLTDVGGPMQRLLPTPGVP